MKKSITSVIHKVYLLETIILAGDFKSAAAKLNITPSALTQSIKSLEAHFEQTLLIREKGQVILTNEGRDLLQKLLPILSGLRALDEEMANQNGPSKIRLGAYDSLSTRYLPRIYSQVKEINPNMTIDLKVGRSSELSTLIFQGHLDMALVINASSSESYSLTKIGETSLSMFIHQDNLKNGQIRNELELGCLRTEQDGRQSFLTKAMNHLNLKSKDFKVQADSFEALLALTLHKKIIALLPTYLAKKHEKELVDISAVLGAKDMIKKTIHPIHLITRKTFPSDWRKEIEKCLISTPL